MASTGAMPPQQEDAIVTYRLKLLAIVTLAMACGPVAAQKTVRAESRRVRPQKTQKSSRPAVRHVRPSARPAAPVQK